MRAGRPDVRPYLQLPFGDGAPVHDPEPPMLFDVLGSVLQKGTAVVSAEKAGRTGKHVAQRSSGRFHTERNRGSL